MLDFVNDLFDPENNLDWDKVYPKWLHTQMYRIQYIYMSQSLDRDRTERIKVLNSIYKTESCEKTEEISEESNKDP